jgi:cell division protein FtsI (penicillin-binding protein 3)
VTYEGPGGRPPGPRRPKQRRGPDRPERTDNQARRGRNRDREPQRDQPQQDRPQRDQQQRERQQRERQVPHARPLPRDRGRDPRDPAARDRRGPDGGSRRSTTARYVRKKILTRGEPGRRLGITLLAIIFVMSLFVGRLVQLQGMESGHYRKLADQQQTQKVPVQASRGEIIGADKSVLAMTLETYKVIADPVQIPQDKLQQEADQLAPLVGLTSAQVISLLQHPSSPQYVVLAAAVSAQNGAAISQLALDGITEKQSFTRSYPDGSVTANVVGFTQNPSGTLLTGEAGVESAYNSLLTGRPGTETEQMGDVNGQLIPLSVSSETSAVNGRNIKLTLYPALQYAAQQACQQEVAKAKARNCSVVIMQPQTGRILAMAQWPTYNPSDIGNINSTTDIPLENEFEPGSTAKVITAAAAFEHGGQTPMSAYNIPYSITLGGATIHDAEWSPGERFTIAGIIAHSSNVGMSQVAEHITPQVQYDYLKAFGLGEPTGLGLPENPGELHPLSQYWESLPYTLSFGQGVDVNAVQMASVYATIANGGVRVQPTLIEGTTNSDGVYTPAKPSPSKRVIQAATAHELMQILQQVPAFDTAGGQPWGEIKGYAIAAKTGTSQETGPECPNTLCEYGASYIGIAPGDNPQLVVAVNVQDPRRGGYYGDIVAGPVFYQVMTTALSTLKIPPDGAVAPYIRLTAP